MARLPTAEALGVVGNAASGGPMSSIQSGAMAEGISTLARAGQRLGATFSEIGDREEAFNTRVSTSTATANMLKEQNAFEQKMRDNPDGWKDYEKEYDQHIQQAKQASAALITDPRQRAIWDAQTQRTVEGWRQRVKSTAYTRQRDAFLSQTQGDIDTLRNIALDPNTSTEDRQMHIETAGMMIEDARRRGFISNQEAGKWSSGWKEGYAIKRVGMLPAQERIQALSTVKHATPELSGAIKSAATELGISPVDLATVISYETGGTFNPWQKGPTTQWGQHRGLIQWGEPQQKKYGVYEGMPVGEQLKAVVQYMRDAGVKPGMKLLDVYSAVNAGAVGRYNASDAANGGAPGTVADKVSNQMAGHRRKAELLIGGGSIDPVTELIPPDQRNSMLVRAQAEQETLNRRAQSQVGGLILDDLNAIKQTGQGLPETQLSSEIVRSIFGEQRAQEWQASRERNTKYFSAMNGIESIPDAEIDRRVRSLEPMGGDAENPKAPGPGYTEDMKMYREAQKHAERVQQARRADPALAITASPEVAGAMQARQYETINGTRSLTPDSAQAVIAARLKAQTDLGIENPMATTRAESQVIARHLRSIGDENPDGMQKFMTELRRTYGEYSETVLASVIQMAGVNRDLSVFASGMLGKIASGIAPSTSDALLFDMFTDSNDIENAMKGRPPPPGPDIPGSQWSGQAPQAGGTQRGAPDNAGDKQPQGPTANWNNPQGTQDALNLFQGMTTIQDFDRKYGPGSGKKVLDELKRRVGQ